MGTANILRDQLRQAHQFLNGTMADVTPEQAHWRPPGVANPLGATYAHVVVGEDAFIAAMGTTAPLFASSWEGRTGLSELPPRNAPEAVLPLDPEWHAWGTAAAIDLPAVLDYAAAVEAAADGFLATLSDDDLARPVDLSAAGLGEQTLTWVLSAGLIGHVLSHWGEIVCLKGMQGGRGFPV